jgi:membrane protein required for colicin V production
MTPVDYLIVALVLISAVVGLTRGVLREVIALLTWLVALFVAGNFSTALEPHLGGLLGNPHVRPWAARAMLVFAVLLVGAAVGAVTAHLVRLSIYSGMDRLVGFVLGVLRGLVILGVLLLLCQVLQLDGESWWHRSLLIPYGEHVAGAVHLLVGGALVRGLAV